MKIASIAVASVAAVVANAQSMSMSIALEEEMSMSVPLFEAEISMPTMSMPDEPVVGAKARKLRNNFGRRTQEAKAGKGPEEKAQEEAVSMSMSVPLFEADISMPFMSIGMSMPLPDEPVVGAKARKLHNNFGRRTQEGKAEKRPEQKGAAEEFFSMSVPLAEQDFSMSAPLFAADIAISADEDEPPTVSAKTRKLHYNAFGRRTQEAKAGKETVEEALSMSSPLFEAEISLPLVDDFSMSAPVIEAEIIPEVVLTQADMY